MNKEKFLKDLEKKLSILNKKEKEDIINEYKNTIEEKIKHGQKEEEAVKDFGDIEKLADEILSAYKIDPNYNKETDFKKFVNDGEHLIKESADKLANATKRLADNFRNNQDINLSLVFEILIKVFFTIIIIGLIRIPFYLFTNIGDAIFETLFTPLDSVIKTIWFIFLSIIYIVLVILLISAMFKEYFKNNKEPNIKEPKQAKKEEVKKETVKKVKNSGPTITSIFMLIVKIWVIIFVLMPLVFTAGAFIGMTLFSLSYVFQGIDLIGLTILLTGISLIFIWFNIIIINLIQGKHKISIYLLIIGIILSAVGGVLFANMITSIDYYDKLPENYEFATVEKTYITDKKVFIEDNNCDTATMVDESLPDNTFIIKARYDENLYDINIHNTDNFTFSEYECDENSLCGPYNYFSIFTSEKGEFKAIKTMYNRFIKDLKNKKVYNYSKLYEPEVKIIANEKTLNLIELD